MFGIYLHVKFYIPSSNVRIVIALKITSKWRFYMLLCYILQTNTSGKCSQCSKQVMGCTVCNSTQRQRNFNLSKISRPLLGPTKLPTQWLPRALYPRVRTSHVHPVPKFRMSGAVPWLPLFAFVAWSALPHTAFHIFNSLLFTVIHLFDAV